MPSRRRFLAAVGAAGAASFSGCSTRSYDDAADGQMYVTVRVGDGADALVALEQK